MVRNQIPAFELISGAAIAFAAILLIVPGFATDILGFILNFSAHKKINLVVSVKNMKAKKLKKKKFIEGEFEDIEDDHDRKI